ncbi:MAG: hypothetical protein M3R09_09265 [Actinomycetota bacterium]|nr:hypothetical protein [Actinomycetota bacterium]
MIGASDRYSDDAASAADFCVQRTLNYGADMPKHSSEPVSVMMPLE